MNLRIIARGVRFVLPLLFVFGITAGPSHVTARDFELNDMWSIRKFSCVRIAPNGKHVLFAVNSAIGAEDELKILDIVTNKSESFTLIAKDEAKHVGKDIVWSKDGGGLIFTMTEGSGSISFWRWDLTTKTTTRLFVADASISSIVQFAESPNGRYIAFVGASTAAKDREEQRKKTMATAGLPLRQLNGPGSEKVPNLVWVWDRTTGKQHQVHNEATAFGLMWSPDSSKFALLCLHLNVFVMHLPTWLGEESGKGIMVVDVETGKTQKLRNTDEELEYPLGWSRDSQSLAVDSQSFLNRTDNPVGILLFAAGNRVKRWKFHPQDQSWRESEEPLFRETPEEARPISFGNGGWFHWYGNGMLYYGYRAAHRTNVIAGATPGGSGRVISDSRWNLSNVSFAEDAEVAAAVRDSANDPQELALIDLKSGQVKTLTSFNDHLSDLNYPRVEPYRVTNSFGYATDNWLIKPKDYQPGKRYPLVILLYNFDNAFHAHPWMNNYAPFEYSRLGMFVLLANYSEYDGALLKGRETFPEKWRFASAENSLASFESAVDRLVGDGLVDATKVAICGFSYGGFLTQYAVTHSTKFSVTFSNDGGNDPNQYYLNGILGWYIPGLYDFIFGGAPYGRGETSMHDFFPVYRLGHLAVPILYEEHGGDRNLFWYGTTYITARQEGTPIDAIVYSDDHIMTDQYRQLTSVNRSTDWLRYWLLGTKNPNPMDKDEYERWAVLRKKLDALKKETTSTR